MFQRYLNLGVFILLFHTYVSAQPSVWQKTLPFYNVLQNSCRLTPDRDAFLLNTDQYILTLNTLGDITGYYENKTSTQYWMNVLKRNNPNTGKPYFLIAERASGTTNYTLKVLIPGQGMVTALPMNDSLSIFSAGQPYFVPLNATTTLVFGQLSAYKVVYNETTGLSILETYPLQVPVSSAAQLPDGTLIVAALDGTVRALDANFNVLWLQQTGLACRSLQITSDGILTCGKKLTGGGAAVTKLNVDGSLQWTTSTDDLELRDVCSTTIGIYATGTSKNNAMVLIKLDNAGALTAVRTEYGKGLGAKLAPTADGGLIIVGRAQYGNVNQTVAIKTDENSLTAPNVTVGTIRERLLQTDSITKRFIPSPSLFLNNYAQSFAIAPDKGVQAMFNLEPWITATGPDNEPRLAVSEYAQTNLGDYRTGIVYGAATDFNRAWLIRRDQIAQLQRDFADNNKIDGLVPFDLLSWPAKGNPNFTQNLDYTDVTTDPQRFPAPFLDYNQDGRYNVLDGDVPQIKGDQMIWWAITDSTAHLQSHTKPILADMQFSVYIYECGANPALSNSIFVDFSMVNRSSLTYTDVHTGFFTDFDLGCASDDYVGTLPEQQACYVYNSDMVDGADCSNSVSYGTNIPVVSFSFLNKSLSKNLNFSSGITVAGIGYPDNAVEYNRVLHGIWPDGTPLTRGGSGYNPIQSDIANYVYPDNPSDLLGWSMCSTGPILRDWLVIPSHGPFTLAPGDTFQISTHIGQFDNIPHPCPNIQMQVKPLLAQIQAWHQDGTLAAQPNLPPLVTIAPGQTITLHADIPGGLSYNWSNGIQTAENTVNVIGNYRVTISNAAGCTQEKEVLVVQETATHTPQFIPGVQVSPNPASDQLQIRVSDGVVPALGILRNMHGQVVQTIVPASSIFTWTINHLPGGLYFLELDGPDGGWRSVQKVVLLGR
jgi:hypothetical protein